MEKRLRLLEFAEYRNNCLLNQELYDPSVPVSSNKLWSLAYKPAFCSCRFSESSINACYSSRTIYSPHKYPPSLALEFLEVLCWSISTPEIHCQIS